MTAVYVTTDEAIKNKVLQRFVSEMADLCKLSMVQGFNARANPNVYKCKLKKLKLGGKKQVEVNGLDAVAAELYDSLSAERAKVLRLSLGDDIQITEEIRKRGIDMRAERAVRDQPHVTNFSFINETTFSANAVRGMSEEMFGSTAQGLVDLTPTIANKKLNCRVREVKCVDETNPEWPGSDEIAWGGIAIAHTGENTKIAEKYVGGGFNDGDKKRYDPPFVLKTFTITATDYPQHYSVLLALAEKDSGGLSTFIQKLWEAVNAEIYSVLASLGAAAGAWIGTQIGGSIGTAVAGPLGTIIGAVAGAVVGFLVGWIIASLKDDIFPTQGTSTYLSDPDSTFAGGSLISAPGTLRYLGHGGEYRVTFDWEIVR